MKSEYGCAGVNALPLLKNAVQIKCETFSKREFQSKSVAGNATDRTRYRFNRPTCIYVVFEVIYSQYARCITI